MYSGSQKDWREQKGCKFCLNRRRWEQNGMIWWVLKCGGGRRCWCHLL